MNILEIYQQQCQKYNIEFSICDSVKTYDDSTLFCPSGMQQFKSRFSDQSYIGTVSNLQSCLRLNDVSEIGDGTHLLYFNMLGLFSFREWSVKQTIDFWLEFLDRIDLKPSYVTIHPDKIDEWSSYYDIEIRLDNDCTWSDGQIGGYCTEFYYNNIEIGNIVNPLGTCIDVGFGFERLNNLVNGLNPKSKEETLLDTVQKIIDLGYQPSNKEQGYILRKLLRLIWSNGIVFEHPYFDDEVKRQERILRRYNNLVKKHPHMPKEWWYSTHGINVDELNNDNIL